VPGRAWAVGLTLLVILAGFGVALLGYRNLGPQNIDWEVVNSQIVDDNAAMKVTFTVTRKHPAQRIECLVRLRDRNGREVGKQVVPVPGSGSSTVTVNAVVPASAAPAVDEIAGCGSKVPNDLTTP
jgi:hypothetical protein